MVVDSVEEHVSPGGLLVPELLVEYSKVEGVEPVPGIEVDSVVHSVVEPVVEPVELEVTSELELDPELEDRLVEPVEPDVGTEVTTVELDTDVEEEP